MSTDYGKRIGTALAAIQQLYADSNKLLQDCDLSLGKDKEPLFGNVVTRDLSRAIYGFKNWMPSALYRYYVSKDQTNGIVDAVTICFYDENGNAPPDQREPLLLVGQITYERKEGTSLRSLCSEWTLWSAYFEDCEKRELGRVLTFSGSESENYQALKMVVVPLYSIRSISDVEQLLDRVRQEA